MRATTACARSIAGGHFSLASARSTPTTYSSSGTSFTTAKPSPLRTISSGDGYSRPFRRIGRSLRSRNAGARRPSISTAPLTTTGRTTLARQAPDAPGPSSTTSMSSPRSSATRAPSTTATRIVSWAAAGATSATSATTVTSAARSVALTGGRRARTAG